MLVLTRRQNESIVISNNIKITVVSVGPGRVKLGIEAPPHVRVDRKEIHDKIEQSADVLAAVGVTASDQQNTLVGHEEGSDTARINPPASSDTSTLIAASAPVTASATATTNAAAPPLPLNKVSKFRPRKPR